jgi:hypothetical protein
MEIEEDDIEIEDNKNDEPDHEEEEKLSVPADVPIADEDAKQNEFTLDKLKKGYEKDNKWFDDLKTSIKILKTKCYPLVNHVIHLLKDSIKGNLEMNKEDELKVKELELQIYATMQVLSDGNGTEASYKQIQEDDDKQIYFYETNRIELLQFMRDQTLEIKRQNDGQKKEFEDELKNIVESHLEIKEEVEKKEEKLLKTNKKINQLFDFFDLIEEKKFDLEEDDPELPTSFEDYMNSEDAKKEFERFYAVQLSVSFGVLYYRRMI